jgi:Domain of unknown function (DUF5680)
MLLVLRRTHRHAPVPMTCPSVMVTGPIVTPILGGTDFLGQETVWLRDEPVWSMTYYGYVLRPDVIDGNRAAQTLRAALSTETAEGRLLDNFEWSGPHGHFCISSEGTVEHFKGRETITVDGTLAYALDYMGGLIHP